MVVKTLCSCVNTCIAKNNLGDKKAHIYSTFFLQEMQSTPSESEQWRKRGNQCYISVTVGLSPSISTARFSESLQYYQRAFDTGKNDDEKSSAAKNIGKYHC